MQGESQLLVDAFFQPLDRMRQTMGILCECHAVPPADPLTQTVLTMIACPVQLMLTAIGWQPFKGRDLTIPYQRMSSEQKAVIRGLLADESRQKLWGMYEHSLVCRLRREDGSAEPMRLPQLDVLEALCTTILHSKAYTDRRMRVAICNIVLQRVQTSTAVEKTTLSRLNQKLFPVTSSEGVTPQQTQPERSDQTQPKNTSPV